MVLRNRLKFFGGLAIALLLLGILLGVAGFVAIRSIDPNRFRAEFEKYLTGQTGFRVELGDIRLQWRPRPELWIAGLKFYDPKSLEKVLQSDRVRIAVDLTPLWQKRFHVSEAVIQGPEIFIKRDPRGVWNWQVIKGSAAPPPRAVSMLSQLNFIPIAEAAEGNGSVSLKDLSRVGEGWEFGIGKILVRDGTVLFTDQTAQPAYRLEIKKLDAEVRQKFPGAPFHFSAGATIFDFAKRNLEAEGDLDLASKSLDLVLRYGPEKAVFEGKLKVIRTTPHFEGTLEVRDLDIEPLIPPPAKEGAYLTGRLSAKAQLAFDGANPDVIRRSLAGQGTIEIRDGALRNRNVIQEVFDRLSPVLAITNALGGELPPEVHEMLKARDTPFDSLQMAFRLQAGLMTIDPFRLTHPNYQLAGQGTYGMLDQRVEGLMELLLSQSISGYLMKKIREMEMIADKNRQIMIPFRYSGIFPEISVQPDLASIAARLLQGGTDQFLNRGLEKLSEILGSKNAVQPPGTDPASRPDPGPVATPEPAGPGGQVSDRDRLIQQGMQALSKILEPEKK